MSANPIAPPTPAAAPVRSMTGYASVRSETSAGVLTVTLRSVNHRGLDLHFHQNSQLSQFENAMRALLKQHIARGHVEIRVSLAHETEPELAIWNQPQIARYVSFFRQTCQDLGLDCKPDLNTFLSLPGVVDGVRESQSLDKSFELEIIAALHRCIHELNSYREREGAELRAAFGQETAAIESQTAQMLAIRAQALPHFLERLRTRLSDLLDGGAISDFRLAEEAALLADRSDIQEELARLAVHTQELHRMLESGGEIGKRLDFLLQEMNRETNTTLSKTSGIGEAGLTITNLALATKANIERMREQALNLE